LRHKARKLRGGGELVEESIFDTSCIASDLMRDAGHEMKRLIPS
jgi:hypothetical protein